ncbi:hypothetical protein HLA97_13725 [Gordonia araii NBRC 100433]|nr:hypothetical protein [Gordonia araii]NNG98301.1 hypothetical protein [Gordonia araii NBRC 100433]
MTSPELTDWTLLEVRSAVKPLVDDALAGATRLTVDSRDCREPDTFLAAVLARLMVLERLEVEVAYVAERATPATRIHRLPVGAAACDLARTGQARERTLIRDDAASVLVGRARHVGADGGRLLGESYLDDHRLFDGEVRAVEIEPHGQGVRARVARSGLARRWIAGRAVQTGGPAVFVEREGVLTPRAVPRSTFYPHHLPWLLVRPTS